MLVSFAVLRNIPIFSTDVAKYQPSQPNVLNINSAVIPDGHAIEWCSKVLPQAALKSVMHAGTLIKCYRGIKEVELVLTLPTNKING